MFQQLEKKRFNFILNSKNSVIVLISNISKEPVLFGIYNQCDIIVWQLPRFP